MIYLLLCYTLFIVLSILVLFLFSAILLLGETSHYGEDAQSKVVEAVSHD